MQLYFKLVTIVVLTHFATPVKSRHYRITENYFREKFQEYELDFDKYYENKTVEERSYNNFVNNLLKINELNAKLSDNINNTKSYVVNKYTDANLTELNEYYGLNLKPCK